MPVVFRFGKSSQRNTTAIFNIYYECHREHFQGTINYLFQGSQEEFEKIMRRQVPSNLFLKSECCKSSIESIGTYNANGK